MGRAETISGGSFRPVERTSKSIHVVLIDPKPFSRACTLAGLVAAPEFTVEAFESLEPAGEAQPPDVVLLQEDPGEGARTPIREQFAAVKQLWPKSLVVVVAHESDIDRLISGLLSGVAGILTPEVNLQFWISSIRLIVGGLVIYPRRAAEIVRSALTETEHLADTTATARAEPSSFSELTPRQHEVLQLLAQGLSNRKIASMLRISVSTVKVHVRAIMAQTGVTNRTQVVAQYMGNKPHP